MSKSCPDAQAWRELLDASAAGGAGELAHHLETCATCQGTMETLIGRDAWDETARSLDAECGTRDAALVQVMHRLKEQSATLSGDLETEVNAADVLSYLRPADRPDLLGYLGAYEIREVIGRGGMGVVLKGFDPVLHRLIAIKVLTPRLASSGTARKRFVCEARAAAAITHDHVLTIHSVDETVPFLVMPFVAGPSLQQKLDRSGPLPVAATLRIGAQTAAGLAAAHAQGLVHRDVKPANILLENGERVKITDFGLARAADEAGHHERIIAGTPGYMAPEQARGEPLDSRADLFSLGSVLYAMCTGRAPFHRTAREHEALVPMRELNPEVPDWLDAIVMRLLAENAADRFASAAEVAALLEEHLVRLQNPVARYSRGWVRVRLALAAAILLGVVALSVAEATGVTQLLQMADAVLRPRTPDGMLVVDMNDPKIKVTVEGTEILISGPGPHEIRLRPGQHRLRASKDGKALHDEIITITEGGKRVVRVTLEPLTQAASPELEKAQPKMPPRPTEGKIFEQPVAVWSLPEVSASSGTFSHDDQTLVVGLWNGSAELWDVKAGKRRATLRTAAQQLRTVAVAPDNKTVATGTSDGVVRLWDLETATLRQELTGHVRPIYGLAFSADGGTLASCGGVWTTRGELRFWDLKTGKPRFAMPALPLQAWSVAYTPGGKSVALALGGPGRLATFSAIDGQPELRHDLPGYARRVAVSPDGALLAVAYGEDGMVRILDAKAEERYTFPANLNPIFTLAFLHQGKRLLTSGVDGTATIWDIDAQKARRAATFLGHTGTVYFAAASHDGRTVATGAGDRTVRIWDVSSLLP